MVQRPNPRRPVICCGKIKTSQRPSVVGRTPRQSAAMPGTVTAHLPQIDPEYQLYCKENSPLNLTAYPAIGNTYPLHCEITSNATKVSSSQDLPSNHRFLVDSFQPDEIKKVLSLLHSNSSLLPSSLLPALEAHDFDGIIQFLLSAISTGHKEIFLPFYLPPETQFKLHVSENPLSVQINQLKSFL